MASAGSGPANPGERGEVARASVAVRDGTRIHYRRLGRGRPMVLLHGFPQTGHMWRKVMPPLAARFDVIAPDLRGYGDSDRPTHGYDKRSMAQDIVDLLDALGLGAAALVGHDRGARVAHRFALDHPGRLTHLVLLDIAPTYDVFMTVDRHNALARWHWFFQQLPDLPEALVAGREELYLRYLYKMWAHNPAAIEEEAVAEYVRCFRQAGALRAAFDDYRAGATVDLEQDGADRDRKVTAPTLVLWGEGRRAQAKDMVAVWKDRCERVEGRPVVGSGHFIPEEQSQAVIDAVLAFVG